MLRGIRVVAWATASLAAAQNDHCDDAASSASTSMVQIPKRSTISAVGEDERSVSNVEIRAIDEAETCPKTWDGGCWEHKKLLLTVLRDAAYTVNGCRAKCEAHAKCEGFFLDKTNTKLCILYKNGCTPITYQKHYSYYRLSTCAKQQTETCPKTWDGGCWEHKKLTLTVLRDAAYTVNGCRAKCEAHAKCEGFFLDKTNTKLCILYKDGCTPITYQKHYSYYRLSTCASKALQVTPKTTTTTTIRPKVIKRARKSWVRLNAGEKCDSNLHTPIDNLADCKTAFHVLKLKEKQNEQIKNVTAIWKPKGCSSNCFNEHSGHFCRFFNDHPTGNGKGGAQELVLLCKNNSAQTFGDKYARISSEGETCKSANLSDVDTFEDCAEAFEEETYHAKGSEHVHVVSNPREPKGCFSDCFDAWDGYSCRKFNEHATGNGAGSDNSRKVLCAVSK
jgi:hypothetical protein